MQNYTYLEAIKTTSLQVAPYFATLIDEDENTLSFELSFSILQSDIIKNLLNKVTVVAINKNVISSNGNPNDKIYSPSGVDFGKSKKRGLASLQTQNAQSGLMTQTTGLSEIESMINSHENKVSAALQKSNSIIAKSSISIFNFVDPSIVAKVKEGKDPSSIDELYKPINTIDVSTKEDNLRLSNISAEKVRLLNLELISKFQIDPADISSDLYEKNKSVSLLKQFYLNDIAASLPTDDVYYAAIKKRKFVDRITLTVLLQLPKATTETSVVDIVFELYKEHQNVPVDRITKKLDVPKHLSYKRFVSQKPTLQYTNNQLHVTQVDKQASGVEIRKKEVNNVGFATSYLNFLSKNMRPGVSYSFNAQERKNIFDIYRCFLKSSSGKEISPYFRSIVAGKNTKFDEFDTTGLVITSNTNTNTINLAVNNPPKYARQFRIIKKKHITGSAFGPAYAIAPFQSFEGSSSVVSDTTIKNDEIYQFYVEYKTDGGAIRKSVSQIYKYKSAGPNSGISTTITDPITTIVNGKPNVQFTISTIIQETQEKKIKSSLERSNISQQFTEEINKTNDQLGKIVLHRVTRVNMKNGLRETFEDLEELSGQGTNDIVFTDNEKTQAKFAINPIDTNTVYLYEVSVSLRDTENSFRDKLHTETIKIGSATKTYSYHPYKWKQPFTRATGTLPAEDNAGNITLRNSLIDDSEIGVTATYMLPAVSQTFALESVNAERVDANNVRLLWTFQGNISDYDHFLIIKEVDRKRTFLGAVFSQFAIDKLQPVDAGTIIYYIVPVFKDYSIGVAKRSNTTIVDPEETNKSKKVSRIRS